MKKRNLIVTLLLTIGLISITVGVSVAFFNYTRTGIANTFSVGRIYFNTTQDGNISLTNVFPIKAEDLDDDENNHDSVTINIEGDTEYSEGIEYLITFDQVNNTVNGKQIPVAFNVSATNIGTSSNDYWNSRGGETSIYELTESGNVTEDKYILVGYIAEGETGIDGSIEISAYLDASNIAISDTLENGDIEVDGYTNGTTSDWVAGRTVLTTSEWNGLQSSPISFKVRAEANEGIWVEEDSTPASCFTRSRIKKYQLNTNMTNEEINTCSLYFAKNNGEIEYQLNTNMTDEDVNVCSVYLASKWNPGQDEYETYELNTNMTTEEVNTCVNYLTNNWGAEEEGVTVDAGETYEDYCSGTGTIWGATFQQGLDDDDLFSPEDLEYFEEHNIIDGPITKNITEKYIGFCRGTGMYQGERFNAFLGYDDGFSSDEMDFFLEHNIISYIVSNDILSQYIDFCAGTGTLEGETFQKSLDNNEFSSEYLTYFVNQNIILENYSLAITGYNQSPIKLNNSMTNEELNKCIQYFSSRYTWNNGETPEAFCQGTGTNAGYTIQQRLDGGDATLLQNHDKSFLIANNIIKSDGECPSDVVVPSIINVQSANGIQRLKVVEIGEYVFDSGNGSVLSSIDIPDTVTRIGGYAFSNHFTSISIGRGIEYIGESCFRKTIPSMYSNANPYLSTIRINKPCSVIKQMDGYPWMGDLSFDSDVTTTIYGANNEVCDVIKKAS